MFARILCASLPFFGISDKVGQLVCTDTACSQDCSQNEFDMNTCIRASAGGSMMFLQCDSSGVIFNSFDAEDCSGAGARHEDGVGTCLQTGTGDSFINTCESGKAQNHTVSSAAVAPVARCSTCLLVEAGAKESELVV